MTHRSARVSTAYKDLTAQRVRLDAAGCEKVYCEQITGPHAGLPQPRKLVAALRPCNVVITPAVDRISWHTTNLLMIARQMNEAGAGLRSLAEPLLDTISEFAEIVLEIFGVTVKRECRRVLELTPRGRPTDNEQGVKFGRKPKLTSHQQRQTAARVAAGEPQRTVYRRSNVSQATMSRCNVSLFTPIDCVPHHA